MFSLKWQPDDKDGHWELLDDGEFLLALDQKDVGPLMELFATVATAEDLENLDGVTLRRWEELEGK